MQKLTIDYNTYSSWDQLGRDDQMLVVKASEACETAFAPYSGFRVGAALRLQSGEILSSSNQESGAFPSGMCAERSLLYYVKANRPSEQIAAIAIASVPGNKECYPCGACRQVLLDARKRQDSPIKVIMSSESSATVLSDVYDLMPFAFEM